MDIPLISASQIAVFAGDDGSGKEGCERKWGFKYLAKIETPQHPSAALGTDTHDNQLNPYLMEGRPFDFTRPSGEIANALVPLLPKPKAPGMRVKRWFEMPSPRGGFGYRGELDLYAPDSSIVPGLASSGPLVGDFKTTSNLTYAKTGFDLLTNIQAQLYAMAVMYEDNVDAVDLVWFYVKNRKPHKVLRSQALAVSPHVAAEFERIDEIGSRLVGIKLARPNVEELRPNVRVCEAFGGCPFRAICSGATNPTVQALEVNKEKGTMNNSFLQGLRKQVGAPEAPAFVPVPAASVPAPSAVPQPPPREPSTEFAKKTFFVQKALDEGLITQVLVAREGLDGAFAKLQILAPADWFNPPVPVIVPINPPESALPPAPPVGVAAPAVEAPKPAAKRGRPAKEETPDAGPTDVKALVVMMRELGIKRLSFDGAQIKEIEVS